MNLKASKIANSEPTILEKAPIISITELTLVNDSNKMISYIHNMVSTET